MSLSLHASLQELSTISHGRLIIQGEEVWMVLQSYAKPQQALCEVASNTYLPESHHIDTSKEEHARANGFSWRRNNRTLGKIVAIATPEQRQALIEELSSLYATLYQQSLEDAHMHIQTDILSGIQNRTLCNTMRQLSIKRTHELRLEVYRTFLNSTVMLAMESPQTPRTVELLAKLPCYAVFTDDKSIRNWDPRGTTWKKMYGFEVIRMIMKHNPGSLLINPRGDISGEFYLNELQTLLKACQRY